VNTCVADSITNLAEFKYETENNFMGLQALSVGTILVGFLGV